MNRVEVWCIDQSKILTRNELTAVLKDLTRRAQRSKSARMSLALVRLACCCGLRVSEIAGLWLDDVQTNLLRPVIRIRPELAKGGRGRMVPLWWDAGTLTDLAARKAERLEQGAKPHDPFVCALSAVRPLTRQALRFRFRTACKVLGPERTARLTIHHGRHTFISHALAGGRTLAEVRDAAGHTNLIVTSAYLHLAVDDDGAPGSLFAFD